MLFGFLNSKIDLIFKDYAETVQKLEKELNLKTKYEIDYQYMNSLKYTVNL